MASHHLRRGVLHMPNPRHPYPSACGRARWVGRSIERPYGAAASSPIPLPIGTLPMTAITRARDAVFDEAFLRKLERLDIVARKLRAGILRGERRSTKRGQSVEFADFRLYSPGDDLRRVDWNVYARTERAFIKLFVEEEDRTVHVLLDVSPSMDWGENGEHKL